MGRNHRGFIVWDFAQCVQSDAFPLQRLIPDVDPIDTGRFLDAAVRRGIIEHHTDFAAGDIDIPDQTPDGVSNQKMFRAASGQSYTVW